MATLKDSAYYAAIQTNKYLADNRQAVGVVRRIPIEVTVVAPNAINDTYNCCVIPANHRVTAVELGVAVANTASSTIGLGDSGDADRYVVAGTAMVAITDKARIANTAMGYIPTADTIVVISLDGASPTTGAKIVGYIDVSPAF